MDIKKYIGEATEYDKKQEVERRKVKSWLKSVSAFANGTGGCLIFGVSDDDRIVGLADAKADAEFVSQKVKERIDPVPQTVLKIEREEGKDLLILQVLPGDDTPYYYMGDGVLETFMRIGNESVVADATEHKRLVLRGRNASFDARPSDELFENFSFERLRGRFYAWNNVGFDSRFFRSFGLVDEKGILTNAGLLMADDCRIRQSRVFCTRWNGRTKAGGTIDARDSCEITGSLITLLENTMDFIRRNTRTLWYKEPMQRIEIPEYIERSVMEAVTNSLAHRDYLILGSEVHVDMYDDRLVIYSPGSMPEGHIIQDMNIDSIPSIRRNPVIADIFAQLGYMERKGSGMGKILGPYRAQPFFTERMLPTLYSDRSQFTVTFPNMIKIWQEEHEGAEIHYVENDTHGDASGTLNGTLYGTHVPQSGTLNGTQNGTHGGLRGEELDEWIAYQLAVHPKMTTDELASLSGRGIRTIKRHVAGMQRLKFVGSGANGYWLVGPKVEKPMSKRVNHASEQVSEQVSEQASGQVGGQVSGQVSGQVGGQVNETIQKMLLLIGRNYLSIFDIQKAANISSRRYVREKMLVPAIEQGLVLMEHPDSPRHPKQRYYLSEKGLKLAEKEN